MELNEYKQGKRVAGEEHMHDMFNENYMLQTENDKLRTHNKALSHTIEAQKSRITDLMAKVGVEELIMGYIKENEELRSRLVESEAAKLDLEVKRQNSKKRKTGETVTMEELDEWIGYQSQSTDKDDSEYLPSPC